MVQTGSLTGKLGQLRSVMKNKTMPPVIGVLQETMNLSYAYHFLISGEMPIDSIYALKYIYIQDVLQISK